jgi:hypothetical protein
MRRINHQAIQATHHSTFFDFLDSPLPELSNSKNPEMLRLFTSDPPGFSSTP